MVGVVIWSYVGVKGVGGPFVMVAVVGVLCGSALVVARWVKGRTRIEGDGGG